MRNAIRKTAKVTGITLLSLVSFIALYLLTAYVCSRITVAKENVPQQDIAIYIKTNGIHTDIVVPVHTSTIHWAVDVPYCNTRNNDSTCGYLAMGWGDKGFYLQTPSWADLKLSVAFNAAFWRSTTAMHATYYPQMTEDIDCRKVMISKEQYARLVLYIRNSFRQDADGHFINIPTNARYSGDDAFYEGNGTYSLLRTCNTWANSALKASGQSCCLWTILDKPIFEKYN